MDKTKEKLLLTGVEIVKSGNKSEGPSKRKDTGKEKIKTKMEWGDKA
jgi:hypothetical protein